VPEVVDDARALVFVEACGIELGVVVVELWAPVVCASMTLASAAMATAIMSILFMPSPPRFAAREAALMHWLNSLLLSSQALPPAQQPSSSDIMGVQRRT
jgi:hypothetical protein